MGIHHRLLYPARFRHQSRHVSPTRGLRARIRLLSAMLIISHLDSTNYHTPSIHFTLVGRQCSEIMTNWTHSSSTALCFQPRTKIHGSRSNPKPLPSSTQRGTGRLKRKSNRLPFPLLVVGWGYEWRGMRTRGTNKTRRESLATRATSLSLLCCLVVVHCSVWGTRHSTQSHARPPYPILWHPGHRDS